MYNIGQISDLTGLSIYTLRYYDKEGLLPFVKRDEKNIRRFSDEDIKIINLISCLKNTGMPIKSIKKYMDLLMLGDSTSSERKDMLIEHKKKIEEGIEKTKVELNLINLKIKYYEKNNGH